MIKFIAYLFAVLFAFLLIMPIGLAAVYCVVYFIWIVIRTDEDGKQVKLSMLLASILELLLGVYALCNSFAVSLICIIYGMIYSWICIKHIKMDMEF